jgi:transposase
MTLRVRAMSKEEREALGRMARSRTVGAGLVRRAQIIMHALEGLKAPEISARMDLCGATVRHWLKRFNARGLPGLEEDVRSGRPPTYSAEQRSAVITTALTRPANLGLPFACWTLDRLVAYLSEQGIAMRRSRISEIFIQEGLSGGMKSAGSASGSTLTSRAKATVLETRVQVDRRCSASRRARPRARPSGGSGLDPSAPPVSPASMRSTPGVDRSVGQAGRSCQVVPAASMAFRRTTSLRLQAAKATLGGSIRCR